MAYTNAERQKRYRQKARKERRVRLEPYLPLETAQLLAYLAWYWQCSQQQALAHILEGAWKQAGRPIIGYDDDGQQLPEGAPHPNAQPLAVDKKQRKRSG